MKTHVVVFKEAGERDAQPEIYTCAANEVDAIQELLDKVGKAMGQSTVSYTEFTEEVDTVTLAELQERRVRLKQPTTEGAGDQVTATGSGAGS